MIDAPWWERWPEVYDREIAALDAAGIRWERDESAFSKGILRLSVNMTTEAGPIALHVVYPDDYPYFRFQVYAPDLDLPYHQNPFQRNLCLIGRRTHYWHTDDTAAGLLIEQIPKLMATARAEDAATVADLEEQQAEPFSSYYPYKPSMILVQSDWLVGKEYQRGSFSVGTCVEHSEFMVRGAMLELRSEAGDRIFSASPSWRRAFSGTVIDGRWVRASEPIRQDNEAQFLDELLDLHPQLIHAKATQVANMWVRIWGILFPEQTAHRVFGEGWVFLCAVDKTRPNIGVTRPPHFRSSRQDAKLHKGR